MTRGSEVVKSPSLRWSHEFPATRGAQEHLEHITQDTGDLMLKDQGIAMQKYVRLAGIFAPQCVVNTSRVRRRDPKEPSAKRIDLAPSSVASRGSLVAHLGASAWKRLKAVPRCGNHGDEIQASRGVGKPKRLLLPWR
jgi:hypothetical protein